MKYIFFLSDPKIFDNETSKETMLLTKSRDTRLNNIPKIGPKFQKNLKSSKTAKRVSFDIGATRIITYEIKSGNCMKKCPPKDALMLLKKRRRAEFVDRKLCPQIQQFLMHIFLWDPEWLEVRKKKDFSSLVQMIFPRDKKIKFFSPGTESRGPNAVPAQWKKTHTRALEIRNVS